jgi:HTH-type transcriptional regulator / antitoxin HipB
MFIRRAADLGALVRDRRKSAGLTQAELAKRLGTSPRWLSELERGKPTAELEMALRALNALDVPLSAGEPLASRPSSKPASSRASNDARPRINVNDLVDD